MGVTMLIGFGAHDPWYLALCCILLLAIAAFLFRGHLRDKRLEANALAVQPVEVDDEINDFGDENDEYDGDDDHDYDHNIDENDVADDDGMSDEAWEISISISRENHNSPQESHTGEYRENLRNASGGGCAGSSSGSGSKEIAQSQSIQSMQSMQSMQSAEVKGLQRSGPKGSGQTQGPHRSEGSEGHLSGNRAEMSNEHQQDDDDGDDAEELSFDFSLSAANSIAPHASLSGDEGK